MSKKSSERREHPRVKASFALEITRHPDVLVAAAEDLSRSGMLCSLPEPVPTMTKVNIALCLPPVGPGSQEEEYEIRTNGVIVRCESSEKGKYQTAIFFPDLSEEDAIRIDKFVKTRS